VNVDECCKGEKYGSAIENLIVVKVNEKTAQVNYE
jgi:hypothetical protein